MTPADDWHLLDRYVREQAHEAFAQIVAKYSGMVFLTALRRTRNRELAEDVTQAVFIVLARRAGQLKKLGSLGAWLHKTALYAGASAVRAESRRRRHERVAAISENAAVVNDERPELPSAIDKALLRLRSGDRQIICLHYLEARPMGEIAQSMNLSPEAAHKRLTRAMNRLRGKLSRAGIPSADISTALISMSAKSSHNSATNIASTATAGGAGGRGFTLARGMLARLRAVTLAKTATAAIVGIALSGGAVAAISSATRPQKTSAAASASQPATAPVQSADAQAVLTQLFALGKKIQSFKASVQWSESPLRTLDGSRTIPLDTTVAKNTYDLAFSGKDFYCRQFRVNTDGWGVQNIAIGRGDLAESYQSNTGPGARVDLGSAMMNDPRASNWISTNLLTLCPWRTPAGLYWLDPARYQIHFAGDVQFRGAPCKRIEWSQSSSLGTINSAIVVREFGDVAYPIYFERRIKHLTESQMTSATGKTITKIPAGSEEIATEEAKLQVIDGLPVPSEIVRTYTETAAFLAGEGFKIPQDIRPDQPLVQEQRLGFSDIQVNATIDPSVFKLPLRKGTTMWDRKTNRRWINGE